MDSFYKQIIMYVIAVAVGLTLLFTGLFDRFFTFLINFIEPAFSDMAKGEQLIYIVAYIIEILIPVLLMLTPLSAVAGIWFFKIAYDLTFGMHRDVNVFALNSVLNVLIAFMCILVAFYCFYIQYNWSKKLSSPIQKKYDEKEISRLI